MRVTAKIATAGVVGLSRFPVANASIDECLGPDGHLDEGLARRALDTPQVQFSSGDDRRVVAFTLEYLTQMRSVIEHLAAQLGPGSSNLTREGAERGVRTDAQTPGDRRCEARMKRGYYAFVRTDITANADGIRARLSCQNPRNVVGHTERFARDFAIMCARILIYMRNNISTAAVTLTEGDGAEGVFDEARDLDRRLELRDKRDGCRRRTSSGYCSPICPDCPLYRFGRCEDPVKEKA